ncbi:3-demethylubiquinone-9 3-methyltransferase [Caballeronia novacaledonica]|uniref:3-demethylubiquinone-9 3-methyltransferase n=1 Tax=Caballeronia novacaledonica TaxID=1544861 RepID=A0A2U3I6Z5_9BURK|nr:VOC family protein [Caballeronia novacaledonica]SPB15963.1 3-demethylubiquinone-9 3-methyltransferase [Caballeronia novacaledonica]
MQLDTYILYNGDCAAALELYQAAFGAKIAVLVRFRDAPDGGNAPPDWQDKITHAVFCVGSNAIMVSDGRYGQPRQDYSGFTLSISADDAQSGERIFNMLAEGGNVLTPWQSTFWTQGFGMLVDRFGVPWLINVVHEAEAQPA